MALGGLFQIMIFWMGFFFIYFFFYFFFIFFLFFIVKTETSVFVIRSCEMQYYYYYKCILKVTWGQFIDVMDWPASGNRVLIMGMDKLLLIEICSSAFIFCFLQYRSLKICTSLSLSFLAVVWMPLESL